MKRLMVALALVVALSAASVGFWSLRPAHDGLGQPDVEPAWFEDVTDTAGLDFVHDTGDLSKFQQPQIHGSGIALFDYDGDGWLDIYLLSYGGPDSRSTNRLYKNMRDGTFKDVTAGSGLGLAGYNTGVAIGDINNDGWPDVVVTQCEGVKLFLNNGNGTFTDVTEDSGLVNPLWACSASFIDYDRDGWLDLVVVNYLEYDPNAVCYTVSTKRDYCGPTQYPGTVTRLFRNLGQKGAGPAGRPRFQDVTVAAGLAKAPGPGLAVYCADFDGDGWPDIFVANDNKPNHLWINQHDGTFTEEALRRGIAVDAQAQAQAGMGVAVGDVNGDGLFAIYVTHLAMEHNTLWVQGPKRGWFKDKTGQAGLLNSQWRGTGFGTLMGDFDHDGWPDIAVVNGAIARGTPTPNPRLKGHLKEYSERNQLFRNLGKRRYPDVCEFRDISPSNPALCGTPEVGRALAQGDLFGRGRLDLVVSNVAGRARIYRNVAPNRGHWLQIRALDPLLKRDAFGAEVRVVAGDRQWLRIVSPQDSFQSSSDPRIHFGLGAATQIDRIHVLWPDGLNEVFGGGEVDQMRVLRRGEGTKG
jgi:hypothetical protein